ncbi:NAD(P)/FAD-dependent oxidoreductase [Novosphingobium flavum]|uniref:NAD(P)/FAD-dependent oxidoreductase n=1 Tax=Novosphingobium aerophilum TaxID=2839843 RepID=A0A7X1FA05_9SPHN|nr:NAD(P)/FAD-dependent oxidoreductase [Novosphingobium aerophilum]MBC2653145.1 NAD(P)/FAD-dependent oxidoreductase [Novosphingobium aerophilum]MBC2661550.1 NAD(P)/FAD-dependent oxidoreductase [Novosphingobium aerophilum]
MDAAAQPYDAIVLGAGAAGMMCALTAGQRGLRVLLIDHGDAPGRKILISGGGRCNFTNLHTAPDRYLSANPHFAKSALGRYSPQDFLTLIERHGIAWHEKTLGQLFCDGSARQIVDLLMQECAEAGVTLLLGHPVAAIAQRDGLFHVTRNGIDLAARALVLATGGPAIPKLGATGFAYDVARQFGLSVVQPRPALVPFTLGAEEALFQSLSGVATEVEVHWQKTRFREAALFTHKGLSGPAMLQISSYWQHRTPIAVDFAPDAAPGWLVEHKQRQPRGAVRRVLASGLPARLAEVLAERLGLDGELGTITDKRLRAAEAQLARWPFQPNGTEGFAKAEVTAGGIATRELSSRTMMATRVPGLYAIGECVDVTGWLGGYNFQWAWASGWAAGQALAEAHGAGPSPQTMT